ncbi:MAG: DUF6998 domain-containing protein [Rhizobiaceae bacterium]
MRHLTGRIGELYAAMITRGQMALETNQRGYDVVAADGRRVSVKTYTSKCPATFKASTFDQVDWVIVLRFLIEDGELSIVEDIDCAANGVATTGVNNAGFYSIPSTLRDAGSFGAGRIPIEQLRKLRKTDEVLYDVYRIVRFENASVIVERGDVVEPVAKPILRKIAEKIGVNIYRDTGEQKNTRTLGLEVIRALNVRDSY